MLPTCSYIYYVKCMPNYAAFFFLQVDKVNSVFTQVLYQKIYPWHNVLLKWSKNYKPLGKNSKYRIFIDFL